MWSVWWGVRMSLLSKKNMAAWLMLPLKKQQGLRKNFLLKGKKMTWRFWPKWRYVWQYSNTFFQHFIQNVKYGSGVLMIWPCFAATSYTLSWPWLLLYTRAFIFKYGCKSQYIWSEPKHQNKNQGTRIAKAKVSIQLRTWDVKRAAGKWMPANLNELMQNSKKR